MSLRRRYPLGGYVQRPWIRDAPPPPPPPVTWPPDPTPVPLDDIEIPISEPTLEYRYFMYETLSGAFVTELPVTYCSYTDQLNGPGGCELHLPLRTGKASPNTFEKVTSGAFGENVHSIAVIRNGVCVWAGILGKARVSSSEARVTLAAQGFWSFFRQRYIRGGTMPLKYTNVDMLAIARSLVQHCQANAPASNLGILTGTETSGHLLTREFNDFDFKTYGEAIEDMADDELGFDFRIVTTLDSNGGLVKNFRCAHPRLGARRDFVIGWGSNMVDYQYERDGAQQFNRVWGIGAGEGRATVLALASDTASFNRLPLMERTLSRKEITAKERLVLERMVRGELRRSMKPVELVSTTLYDVDAVGAFQIGDSVQVYIDDGFTQVDAWMRTLSKVVRVQDSLHETVDVSLGPEAETGNQ